MGCLEPVLAGLREHFRESRADNIGVLHDEIGEEGLDRMAADDAEHWLESGDMRSNPGVWIDLILLEKMHEPFRATQQAQANSMAKAGFDSIMEMSGQSSGTSDPRKAGEACGERRRAPAPLACSTRNPRSQETFPSPSPCSMGSGGRCRPLSPRSS